MASMKDVKQKRQRQYTDAKQTAHKQQSGSQVASLDLPRGMQSFFFKKEGMYYLDVLPFVAGKNNPMADEGYFHWERTYWAHRGVGAENKQYCCPLRNWGDPCPICEYRQQLERRGASEDAIKALVPKKRQIMAIVDLDDKDKGVQVFEGPYAFGLGQLIDNKIKAARDGSPVTRFYHAEGGMTLAVLTKSEGFKTNDGNSGKFIKPINIDMEARETNYEDTEVPCLDDLLKKPDYEKLKEVFHKGVGDEEEEESNSKAPPSNNSRYSREAPKEERVEKAEDVEEEENDEEPVGAKASTSTFVAGDKVKHPTYGVCTITAIGEDGKLKIRDKDGVTHRAIKSSEVKEFVEVKEAPVKSEIRNLGKPKTVAKKNDEEE